MRPLTASLRCGLGMNTAVLKAEVLSRMALRLFWHRRRESGTGFVGHYVGRVPVVCGEGRQRVLCVCSGGAGGAARRCRLPSPLTGAFFTARLTHKPPP